jgi:hypothetical protein
MWFGCDIVTVGNGLSEVRVYRRFMAIDEGSGWVPESCSLPTVEQPLRVAEFDRLFGESVLRSTRVSTTRLDLVLVADAEATARDLAAREIGCCSFFSFDFASAGSDVVMSIGVPESRADVLDGSWPRSTRSWRS